MRLRNRLIALALIALFIAAAYHVMKSPEPPKPSPLKPDNEAWAQRILKALTPSAPVPKRVPQLKNHY